MHAASLPVNSGSVRWGQAFYGQCFGKGSWFMVFRNVDHKVFIGTEVIFAVLLCDFAHVGSCEDVYVLQIHAAAFVVSTVGLSFFQAGRAATRMAAALTTGLRW